MPTAAVDFIRCGAILVLAGIAAVGIPPDANAHSPHDHIEAFELGPGSEGIGTVMLIVVRGNLWRSFDGGTSWKRIVRGLDNRHEIVSIANEVNGDETRWYLKTRNDGVIYRSGDDGWSWQRAAKSTPFPGDEEVVEFEPAGSGLTDKRITSVLKFDESRLFVSTWNDGVFFSNDGGKNWERRAKGLTTDPQGDRRGLPQFTTLRRGEHGALLLAGYDGLFRSVNEGRSWEELETLPETLLIDFDVSPNHRVDGELLAITYWKGAFHSRDQGATWHPISGNRAPSRWNHLKRKLKGDDEYAQIARFHSIAFSPDYANDRTFFAGLRNWFLISNNGGDRWEQTELTQFAADEDVIPDRIVFSDHFAEDRTLFFCSRLGEGKTRRGGVFKSTDGGQSFSLVLEAEGKYLQSLVISPAFSEDGTVFVSAARGANNSEVYRTRDGGETWETVRGDMQFVDYGAELAISPDFAIDGTLWAGTELGFWRSADRGDHWERLESKAFSEDGFVDMVAVSPEFKDNRTILVTVKGEGAFISEDGAESFAPYRPEIFEQNHQFNRLWSYSPGRLIKFSSRPHELYAMTGENLFRLSESAPLDLPVRATAAVQGEVSLTRFFIMIVAVLAVLLLPVWIRRKRRSD